jgi:hypothetical protein
MTSFVMGNEKEPGTDESTANPAPGIRAGSGK